MNIHSGIVENRLDPLEMGRYQVRVFGIHSHDKTLVPTEMLPWASVLQPATSASLNGVGVSPKLTNGSHVLVIFLDGEEKQNPLILGSVGGIGTQSHLFFNGELLPNDNDQYGFTSYTNSDYLGQSDVSKAARSGKTENLRESVQINNIAGAFSEPPDLRPFRQYPYSQVRQSESGHIEEWDDTPENERITTQHKIGTFTEMRPDGDRVTKVIKDNYSIVAGDNNLYVKGNVNILVEGDVNLTTEGDYNLNVGGDYNLRVQGNTFHHTNEDHTEVVNGSKSEYIVNDETKNVGGDTTYLTVGNYTYDIYGNANNTVYGNVTNNTLGDETCNTLGNFSGSVTGSYSLSSKTSFSFLTDGTMEYGSKGAAYFRGSTVDLNDTTATDVDFEDLDEEEYEENKVVIYDQDFESIEADISIDSTSPTIKSTQQGTVDSETFVNSTRSASTAQTDVTRVLNGKTKSSYQSTAGTFETGVTVETDFNNVYYNYSAGTKRDGRVSSSLESILSRAAYASDVYAVEIYSGRQPGSKGRRTGSGRHDTGEAVDVRLIKTKEDFENVKGKVYVNGNSTEGRAIFTAFVQAAIPLGIRGGGFSRSYMGDYGMHLDTLGQIINTKNSRVISSYDRNVLAVWKSTSWFREAFYTADPSYKYFIALASGTRYYSKTNTKWNTIA